MYLTTYDFEIIYCRGTLNPADGPSKRLDYEDGPADVTWLPTFQNKLKGAFAVAIQRACQASGKSSLEPERIMFALSAVARAQKL